MARDDWKGRRLFDDEERGGFAFREVFTPNREGPLPRRPGVTRPPGKGGPSIGQGAAVVTPAQAYLARTVGGNEGGNAANITTLIDGLVSDGAWAKLDCLYVLAQQNATDAKLNLISASYPLVADGSTFLTYKGFIGFTTGLNSGFDPTTAPSPHFTQNSASLGAWIYSVPDNSLSAQMGLDSSLTHIVAHYAGNFYARLNNGSITSVPSGAGAGLYVGDRANASNVNPFINGVDQGALAGVSSTITSNVLLIGNCPTGAFSATDIRLSAAFIGASLGATGQLALYNRLRAYMTVVGVP